MAVCCDEDNVHLKRFLVTLRWVGGVCGLAVIILGIVQLFTAAGTLNPRYYINAIYQIIFGFFIIVCEFRLIRALAFTRFLTHFFGLGMFYVFVGGLGIGSTWYQAMVGGIVIGVGAVYLMLGLANMSMLDPSTAQKLDEERSKLGTASASASASSAPQSRQQGVELKLHATGHEGVDRHIDAAASNAANEAIENKKRELNPWDRQPADKQNPFE